MSATVSNNKRNINELYNGNGLLNNNNNNNNSNGNGLISDQPNGNNEQQQSQDVKKSRLDPNVKQEPSCVVHVRGIPAQLSDNEIIYIGLHFGEIKNVLFLRSKGQAFLQFANLDDAQKMIDYFGQQSTLTFHSKKLFIQFSNHQELNTDPNNSSNQIAQAALNEATQLYASGKQGGKNCVLRMSILNMMYPVTLDVLNQIFSKYGPILKMITFTKNEKFQALVQMKDGQSATNARNSLNGQNIYNGCCTLQIDFSKLNALEVKYNNEKSRDYTNLLLPSGDNNPNTDIAGQNANNNSGFNNFGLINQNPASLFGNAQFPPFAGGANNYNNNNSKQNYQNQNQNNFNDSGITPVLLVTNLNEEFLTPEALFTLFGVYGDVVRVKILFNKKDSALVNFVNASQAAVAMQNLDRCKIWSKQIRVFPSKHATVQMPKDGQSDAGLTKDFTNSPLHRFKKPGSKNFNNIFAPSSSLHLSNIPASVEESDLRELFGQYGAVKGFRFFQKDRKMALIQMSSVEEAVNALIGAHNHQLADNMHLRVAFSKSFN